MNDIVLVVPSIREKSLKDFVDRWRAIKLFDHCDLLIVEDNPKKTFETPTGLECDVGHFDWEEIDQLLGDSSWMIPRRSDTIRSFGYWEAWRKGYKYILTLDDDCYPCTQEDGMQYDGSAFLAEHIRNIEQRSRWFNTLSTAKPRGVPYFNVGKNDDIFINHGLWTKTIDYDAPSQLAAPLPEKFAFDSRIVPAGVYFPMCGMNVMWKAEYTVLMYHLLMGKRKSGLNGDPRVDSDGLIKLPFDRFGDIFAGIILKKIADTKRLSVSTGMPYIRHERASNPFTNLKKEANGIEVNEKFWERVDSAPINESMSVVDCYHVMGDHLGSWEEYPEYVEYFRLLAKAMNAWASLFANNARKK